MTAVRDELRDRYGELPLPVVTLLDVARLRFAARRAGLTDITLQGSHVRFAPVVAAGLAGGAGSAAIPEDAAQAGGAYDAGTGAEVRRLRRGLRRGAAA